MNLQTTQFILTALSTSMIASSAFAHGGRRFDIQVVDNKLVAHGYISDGKDDMGDNFKPANPGDPLYRKYTNAIHAHWATDSLGLLSGADLPGFDIKDETQLLGDDLKLEVLAVKKWSNAPFADFAASDGHSHGSTSQMHMASTTPHHGTGVHSATVHPHFMPITTGETIQVSHSNTPLTTGTPFELASFVGSSGHFDLNFDFIPDGFDPRDTSTFALAPTDAIYVVELQLSTTTDPTIQASDTIHAIFSPSGVDGSHHLSLATEAALGTLVPEPSTLAITALLPVLMRRRRR